MEYKPRILVVDDKPENVELLEAHLLPKGYEVLTASNADEALKTVSEGRIDLILLDVMMPGKDGFWVTRTLRENEKTRLIPIVLITALKETEDRIKGIDAGCDDFITKPFDKNEVLARVKTLLAMNFYRQQLDEKEKFDYILNQIEDGIIVFDKNLKIVRFNEAVKRLLSLKALDENFDFVSHIQSKFKVHFGGDFSMVMRKQPTSFDLEREATDVVKGLILEAHTNIIRNAASGEIANIMMVVRDVTAARVEEMMKQDFFGLISHKLRTPLAGIQGALALLEDSKIAGALSGKQEEFVNMAGKNCKRLIGLVERLLRFTELSRAPMTSNKEKLMLSDYIPQALEQTLKLFQDKKVEKEFIFESREDAVMTNKYYFGIILSELINNALKFNDKDTVKITIKTKKNVDKISISISDNGPGIPPEEQKNVFNKFYQIERYFTGNVPGAGLGLAIAKKFAESSGGEIKLTSVLGQGTEVTIILPAA